MENGKTKIEIPAYVVREQERKPFEEKFVGALNLCKDSYQKLSSMRDLENVPTDLAEIKPEVVNAFIDERIAEVSDAKMLTFDAREKAKQDWEAIRAKALGYIAPIQKFLADYPDVLLTVVNGKVLCGNAATLIVERCKIETPKQVYEHVELIQKVKDVVEALQNFEKANDYPTGDMFNVEMDLKMLADPKTLIENWIWQFERRAEIEKREYLRAASEAMTRRQQAEAKARMEERSLQYQQQHPDEYPMYHK